MSNLRKNHKKRQGQVVLETGPTIELPDQSNPDTPTDAQLEALKGEPNDLVQAALDPAAALAGDPAPIVSYDGVADPAIEDAEFSEVEAVPPEELAAQAMVKGEQTDNSRPRLEEFLDDKGSPEGEFVDYSFKLISDGAQRLLTVCKRKLLKLYAWSKNQYLKTLAFGNDVKDKAKDLGNKAWKWWDESELGKKYDAACLKFYGWAKPHLTTAENWATNTLAKWREVRDLRRAAKRDRAPLTYGEYQMMTDTIVQHLNHVSEQLAESKVENKRLATRCEGLEDQLRKASKRFASANKADPDQVNELLVALSEGRKAKAIDVYCGMTGSSKAEAKAAIECKEAA